MEYSKSAATDLDSLLLTCHAATARFLVMSPSRSRHDGR